MTQFRRTLALALLLFMASASAERPHAEKVFSCRTLTASGLSGLMRVQTFTRERAAEMVVGYIAPTLKGTQEKVVSVVECLDTSAGERFSDAEFRRFVESLEG